MMYLIFSFTVLITTIVLTSTEMVVVRNCPFSESSKNNAVIVFKVMQNCFGFALLYWFAAALVATPF